ncbi:MAG: hypothetical protein IK990_04070 [Ruminiclostridium sp.]|nr:hypothetical protein [Ruminiclostridium sp.]
MEYLFKNEFARVVEEERLSGNNFDHQYFFTDSTERYVIFVNRAKDIRKLVIKNNEFVGFPGIENPELIIPHYKEGQDIEPYVRFGSSCEYSAKEQRCVIYWTIQPDGRYYADSDGFGGENQDEITLYIYIDDEGDYVGKFRIESIGGTVFKGTSREDDEIAALAENALKSGIANSLSDDEVWLNTSTSAIEILLEGSFQKTLQFNWIRTSSPYMVRIQRRQYAGAEGKDRFSLFVGVFIQNASYMKSTYIFFSDTREGLEEYMKSEDAAVMLRDTIKRLIDSDNK